jgi:type IV pilus assembly protein PilV
MRTPARHRFKPRPKGRVARGLVLIDVLIAMLVFSMGVLAIISLQAVAIQQSSQAMYRANATMLANALISRMWLTDRQVATLSGTYATGGTGYEAWLTDVTAALPGAADNPPTVTVQSVPGGAGGAPTARVTVLLQWKPVSAAAAEAPNRLTMVTQLR